jgi:hypothetical protein
MVALLQRFGFLSGPRHRQADAAPPPRDGSYPEELAKDQVRYLHELAAERRRMWKEPQDEMAHHPLADLPQQYDVIWCRFPHRPGLHLPGDPPHPVIVRNIERNDAVGEAIIHVTYGTSKIKKWRWMWDLIVGKRDLIVEKQNEMTVAGLREPTRFDLDDSKNMLPCFWCVEFFPHPWPVGRLNADCVRRLNNRARGAVVKSVT